MNKLILSLFFLMNNNLVMSTDEVVIEQVVQGGDLTNEVIFYLNKSKLISEVVKFDIRALHETGNPIGTTAVFKVIKRDNNVSQIESIIITSNFRLISGKKRLHLDLTEDVCTEEKSALRDIFTKCIVKNQESFNSNIGCLKMVKSLNCVTILPVQS